MELGQLVRTKNKGICKIEGFASTLTDDYIKNEKGSLIPKDEITKVSHNIIDLIEVGDYVNGYIVLDITKDNLGEKYIECGCQDEMAYDYVYDTFYNKDIKTILTKEQFEAMAYKVV